MNVQQIIARLTGVAIVCILCSLLTVLLSKSTENQFKTYSQATAEAMVDPENQLEIVVANGRRELLITTPTKEVERETQLIGRTVPERSIIQEGTTYRVNQKALQKLLESNILAESRVTEEGVHLTMAN